MSQISFDDLMREYRKLPIPELPPSFPVNVLREIRLRSTNEHTECNLISLLFGLLRPGMVAASLSIALAVGVLVPGVSRASATSLTADGLGLNVFSASQLPAGLLK